MAPDKFKNKVLPEVAKQVSRKPIIEVVAKAGGMLVGIVTCGDRSNVLAVFANTDPKDDGFSVHQAVRRPLTSVPGAAQLRDSVVTTIHHAPLESSLGASDAANLERSLRGNRVAQHAKDSQASGVILGTQLRPL